MEKNKKLTCGCNANQYIVLACSGASDLGYISDQVAHKLSRNNVHLMNCLTIAATGTDEFIWSEFLRFQDEIKEAFYKLYVEQIKS